MNEFVHARNVFVITILFLSVAALTVKHLTHKPNHSVCSTWLHWRWTVKPLAYKKNMLALMMDCQKWFSIQAKSIFFVLALAVGCQTSNPRAKPFYLLHITALDSKQAKSFFFLHILANCQTFSIQVKSFISLVCLHCRWTVKHLATLAYGELFFFFTYLHTLSMDFLINPVRKKNLEKKSLT